MVLASFHGPSSQLSTALGSSCSPEKLLRHQVPDGLLQNQASSISQRQPVPTTPSSSWGSSSKNPGYHRLKLSTHISTRPALTDLESRLAPTGYYLGHLSTRPVPMTPASRLAPMDHPSVRPAHTDSISRLSSRFRIIGWAPKPQAPGLA